MLYRVSHYGGDKNSTKKENVEKTRGEGRRDVLVFGVVANHFTGVGAERNSSIVIVGDIVSRQVISVVETITNYAK